MITAVRRSSRSRRPARKECSIASFLGSAPSPSLVSLTSVVRFTARLRMGGTYDEETVYSFSPGNALRVSLVPDCPRGRVLIYCGTYRTLDGNGSVAQW